VGTGVGVSQRGYWSWCVSAWVLEFVMSLLVSLSIATVEISDNGLEYLKLIFVFKCAETLFLQFLGFFRNPGWMIPSSAIPY
jgi:F0F1-type ATP synthase membrane subunit a